MFNFQAWQFRNYHLEKKERKDKKRKDNFNIPRLFPGLCDCMNCVIITTPETIQFIQFKSMNIKIQLAVEQAMFN